MSITRILKNKWIWVAVFFVFIGYQLMDDFATYEWKGMENISQIMDALHNGADKSGAKGQD